MKSSSGRNAALAFAALICGFHSPSVQAGNLGRCLGVGHGPGYHSASGSGNYGAIWADYGAPDESNAYPGQRAIDAGFVGLKSASKSKQPVPVSPPASDVDGPYFDDGTGCCDDGCCDSCGGGFQGFFARLRGMFCPTSSCCDPCCESDPCCQPSRCGLFDWFNRNNCYDCCDSCCDGISDGVDGAAPSAAPIPVPGAGDESPSDRYDSPINPAPNAAPTPAQSSPGAEPLPRPEAEPSI